MGRDALRPDGHGPVAADDQRAGRVGRRARLGAVHDAGTADHHYRRHAVLDRRGGDGVVACDVARRAASDAAGAAPPVAIRRSPLAAVVGARPTPEQPDVARLRCVARPDWRRARSGFVDALRQRRQRQSDTALRLDGSEDGRHPGGGHRGSALMGAAQPAGEGDRARGRRPGHPRRICRRPPPY